MDSNSIYLLPIIGVIGEDFKYTDLLMHLNAASSAQIIKLAINSPGGYIDDGLKMREAIISTGKEIHAINIGDVCSIAVSLFLSANRANRKFDTSKGQFLIHNPLVDPKDIDISLRADDLSLMSKELKSFENQLVKQYHEATGTAEDVLRAFMNEETPLSEEQIEKLGFATIEHPQMKAVALIKTNKQQMTEIKELNEKMSKMEKIFEKVSNFFKAKNLLIQDVNGIEIDFGDAIETPEQITVGVTATVEGSPANGDFVLSDGTTYKFEGGELKEIMMSQGTEEMEALRKENQELKTQLEASTAAQNKLEKDLNGAKQNFTQAAADFKAFKNQFKEFTQDKSDPDDPAKPETFKEQRKKFKQLKK